MWDAALPRVARAELLAVLCSIVELCRSIATGCHVAREEILRAVWAGNRSFRSLLWRA